MKPVILFDVDHTLFDTATWFKEFLTPALADFLDTDSERIGEITQQYQATLEKHTDFHPADFIQWLGEDFEADTTTLNKIFFQPKYFQRSVFPDALACIQILKEKYTLGIFSEARKEWQLQKLELSGLLSHFDPDQIHIFRRKCDADSLEQLPVSTIIDDKLEVVAALAQTDTIEPVWLNRRDQTSDESISTIHSLDEFPELMENFQLD